MAGFHDSDRWFIWCTVVAVLNIALLSGWYRLRNPFYSSLWPVFSVTEILSAILEIALHSKLSSPALLLATALLSLLSLSILVLAIARSYLRVISTISFEQKKNLRFLQWTQYICWVAIPCFISSIACWAQSDSDTDSRLYWRNVGRALNWTGCALLTICFLCSTAIGVVMMIWSPRNIVPALASTVVLGALLSVPFVVVRLVVQMYWMKFRNSTGADFGLHVGGGIVMDLVVPTINLLIAWYTSNHMKCTNVLTHELCHIDERTATHQGCMSPTPRMPSTNGTVLRKSSATSAVSAASIATTMSNYSSTSIYQEGKVNSRFCRSFIVSATGRVYEMDNANVLVRNTRKVFKVFCANFDENENSEQPIKYPYTIAITAEAQRALLHIAKLLWLFTLWDCTKEEDEELRQAIEVDIIAIWYADLYQADSDRPPSCVKVMKPFDHIKNAVLGGQPRRPMEKTLTHVFLHFFDKIEGHAADARAAACIFALKSMLKRDIKQMPSLDSSVADTKDTEVLDADEAMQRRFDK